jgi:hypothetical protein
VKEAQKGPRQQAVARVFKALFEWFAGHAVVFVALDYRRVESCGTDAAARDTATDSTTAKAFLHENCEIRV